MYAKPLPDSVGGLPMNAVHFLCRRQPQTGRNYRPVPIFPSQFRVSSLGTRASYVFRATYGLSRSDTTVEEPFGTHPPLNGLDIDHLDQIGPSPIRASLCLEAVCFTGENLGYWDTMKPTIIQPTG